MLVGYDHCSGSANGIWRSLVRFDLSAIPAGTSITNARLYVELIESCDIRQSYSYRRTSRITGTGAKVALRGVANRGTGTQYGSAWLSTVRAGAGTPLTSHNWYTAG